MHFDTLYTGAQLLDGTGSAPRLADVGVRDGRIVAVGRLQGHDARQRHALDGAVLAPGFIDTHAHDEALLLEPVWPHPKLSQGVTAVVTGQCGISLAPLVAEQVPAPLDILGQARFRYPSMASYRSAVEAAGLATHVVALVGHSSLRAAVMPELDREASEPECARMAALLREALAEGASGLSTGLFYAPARAATAAEVVAVGEPLQAARGLLTMHLRDEGDRIAQALAEAFGIARSIGVPLVLSHHKLIGLRNHGRSRETLGLIEQAARSMPVCLDCYPYVASSTLLMPERVSQCREVLITWSSAHPEAAGRSLLGWAREQGLAPEEAARRLLPAGAVYFAMDEGDVERILAHPLALVGSDGLAHDERPHPRLWGSFPRVLGRYVRERGVLPLATAVHKMTGLAAARLGLEGRGVVAPGAWADLVAFDPARVADRATFESPTLAPEGILGVWVEGTAVCGMGQQESEPKAGRWLRAHAPA